MHQSIFIVVVFYYAILACPQANSVVIKCLLSSNSASEVQVVLLPQPPKQLGLDGSTTMLDWLLQLSEECGFKSLKKTNWAGVKILWLASGFQSAGIKRVRQGLLNFFNNIHVQYLTMPIRSPSENTVWELKCGSYLNSMST